MKISSQEGDLNSNKQWKEEGHVFSLHREENPSAPAL